MQFCRGSNMYTGIAEIMADLADGVIEMCAGPCVNSDISPAGDFGPDKFNIQYMATFQLRDRGEPKSDLIIIQKDTSENSR